MMNRLAAQTLGGATAPLTVALTYWASNEDPEEDDGLACRGVRFNAGAGLLDRNHGEWRERILNVHVCNDEEENGIETPEEDGFLGYESKVFRITRVDSSFGFWDILSERDTRTQVSNDGLFMEP